MSVLDEHFVNWSEWFRSLSDEVEHLLISRETLKQVAGFFTGKVESYDPTALDWFRKWIGSIWGVATAARLRALGDPDAATKSLRCLLDKLRRHPEVFTRERYLRLAGASDSHTTARANKEFDEYFGKGASIDVTRVGADIVAIDAAMETVKPFVDKRIAHLDPRWKEMTLNFGPLYAALDVYGDIVKKHTLIFTGEFSSAHFGSLVHFDARRIFDPTRRDE